ncbi:MAG: nucleotidyltransferase [Candidatus Eisenbacteria bacterium]|nr:nucleotidyltransferase [Candidatus Eisenbacteria bacterium]
MGRKRLPDDFRDFLDSLNKNDVEYLLLGGWAVGMYGAPRTTADLDVYIAVDEANVYRLRKALYEFGAPAVPKEHFMEIGRIYRIGRSPIRIEVINQASGIDFRTCYDRRKTIRVDGISISLISRDDLLKNKAASGRDKDFADLRVLEGVARRQSERNMKTRRVAARQKCGRRLHGSAQRPTTPVPHHSVPGPHASPSRGPLYSLQAGRP